MRWRNRIIRNVKLHVEGDGGAQRFEVVKHV